MKNCAWREYRVGTERTRSFTAAVTHAQIIGARTIQVVKVQESLVRTLHVSKTGVFVEAKK